MPTPPKKCVRILMRMFVPIIITIQHVALFTAKHELTFIDNSGRLNLFARMTKNAYEEVHCTLFGGSHALTSVAQLPNHEFVSGAHS